MLVDSHCHLDCLDLTPYNHNLDAAIQAARDNDVQHMLCVCIDLEHFSDVLSIAEQYDDVTASVGLHPNSQDCEEAEVKKLVEYAQHPKVVAIGETGLDYFRTEDKPEWQRERFKKHIQAARESSKPLIIHTRDAFPDTLKIMQDAQAEEVGGVMHCFTGTWEEAQPFLDLGFYISFSGIVTFKNAKALQEAAQKAPLESMLIETDSPYLAPDPYRGKPNEPRYLLHVAEKIADLRGLSYETVAEQTTKNFFQLFKISS